MRINKYKLQLVKEKGFNYELDGGKIQSPDDAVSILFKLLDIEREPEEIFGFLALDTKNNVLGLVEISRGSLNSSIVHPREVFKRAILLNSSSILLFHNHPSGESEPSHEDIILTNRLEECGKLLGIRVIDHVITGEKEKMFFSFKEESMI